jgi:hypothetical protein
MIHRKDVAKVAIILYRKILPNLAINKICTTNLSIIFSYTLKTKYRNLAILTV